MRWVARWKHRKVFERLRQTIGERHRCCATVRHKIWYQLYQSGPSRRSRWTSNTLQISRWRYMYWLISHASFVSLQQEGKLMFFFAYLSLSYLYIYYKTSDSVSPAALDTLWSRSWFNVYTKFLLIRSKFFLLNGLMKNLGNV